MNLLSEAQIEMAAGVEDMLVANSEAERLETERLETECLETECLEAECLEAKHLEYHSILAMEAARKMRRTRQKRKTGQEVCHHLKMMLAEPLPAPERNRRRSESQFNLGF